MAEHIALKKLLVPYYIPEDFIARKKIRVSGPVTPQHLCSNVNFTVSFYYESFGTVPKIFRM
jgi:hypothetical protein